MLPVSFKSDLEDIPWTVYEPSTLDGRAVVIAYGSDGLSPDWEPEIRRHAEGLAELGILALVPDYFKKIPAVPHGRSNVVFGSILKRHSEWSNVLRDAVSAAKALPSIDASRVGLLGFSLGGFLSLRIRDSVQTLVEFFAPYKFPTVGAPPLPSVLQGIGANTNSGLKVQIHHGDVDALVPIQEHADSIESQLHSEGTTVSRFTYPGANHGFQGDDAANKDAREKSKNETLDFFLNHL